MILTTRVAIGLGTNIEPRLEFLTKAVAALRADFLVRTQCSSIYETPPWGVKDQARFYNAVLVGECDWKPPAIVSYLKTLERELGRKSTVRYGPREIDLDLLTFGNETWLSDGVQVPHWGLADRDFVLVPLVEVWPDWKHPTLHMTAQDLLTRFEESRPRDAKFAAAPLPDKANP